MTLLNYDKIEEKKDKRIQKIDTYETRKIKTRYLKSVIINRRKKL